MHRDFKLSNVLLHNGKCKICDLGFGKQVEQHRKYYLKNMAVKDGIVSNAMLGTSVNMAP